MISPLSAAEKLLSDLVSFPSTAGQSNAEIINYIKSYLENLNVNCKLILAIGPFPFQFPFPLSDKFKSEPVPP